MSVKINVSIHGAIVPMTVSTTIVRPDERVPYAPEIVATHGWRYTTFALDDELTSWDGYRTLSPTFRRR